jgi:eukaryotic-like serine/threonine-protein kinase
MDIPVWLDTLVCQLLEKKPEHRPYDAAMVSKVLDEVEQKVADQRSAGVDAATARTTDRNVKRPADETDRDAARTIRTAISKKKPKSKSVPVTQRKWFQAVMLSSALAGLVGLVYWMTRPPSADKLFQVARAAVEAKADGALDATQRYLGYYGGRDDELTRQVRGWNRDLQVERRDSQLLNRVFAKRRLPPEDDYQKLAYEAIKHENDGDLDQATAAWHELDAKAKDAGDANLLVYSWLAQRKLDDLKSIPIREKQLAGFLDEDDSLKPNPTDTTKDLAPAERQSVQALRFQLFGDRPAARDAWDKVAQDEVLRDPAVRIWGILAANRARELKAVEVSGRPQEKEARLKLVQDRLAEAERVPSMADPDDRRRAVRICRDIIALYGKDPDPQVSEFARKAADLMNQRQWTKPES